MMKQIHFLLLVLLASLLIQGVLWRSVELTDEQLWQQRIVQLKYDLEHGQSDPLNKVWSGHPGMAIVTLAAIAHKAGSSLGASLNGSVTILNALSVVAIVWLCRQIYPGSLWWIMVGAVAIIHPLYLKASPTNAVIAPLMLLMVLCMLWLYMNFNNFVVLRVLVLCGIAIGLALATRMVTTLLMVTPLFLLLIQKLDWRKLLLLAGTSFVVAVGVNPLVWYMPWQHLKYILFRSSLNLTEHVLPQTLSWFDFLFNAPLALLSFSLALFLYVFYRYLPVLIPRTFLLALLAMSGLFIGVFSLIESQSIRYFQPLIFIWEALLPLFLLYLLQSVRLSFTSSVQKQQLFRKATGLLLVALLAGSQVLLMGFEVMGPKKEYLVDWENVSLNLVDTGKVK